MSTQIEYEMKDGNRIPALGLGTWTLRGEKCIQVVGTALKLGYRHLDTAEMYGNQKDIGEALKGFDRSKVFITSKVPREELHYDDMIKACDKTLADLKTSYVDLYLIHWPNALIPLEETFRAFQKLLKDSKIRSVGVSNFSTDLLKEALRITKVPITVDQVEFHPQSYKKELLEFCKENGIVLTAYSPLGRGRLHQNEVIVNAAEKYKRMPSQVCLRWSLQKGVVVIPRSGSENHLKENLDIFNWRLADEDMRKIDSLT